MDKYNTYIKVVEDLKNNEDTLSVILAGSSKNKDLEKDFTVNDIDLFIIVKNQEKDQIREIKTINDVEFDLNYISLQGSKNFIESRTQFFLKIYDGKILYDTHNTGENILSLCKKKYEEGEKKHE